MLRHNFLRRRHYADLRKCSQLNLQETEDLVTFTEEILNGKLHFLCSESNILNAHDNTT